MKLKTLILALISVFSLQCHSFAQLTNKSYNFTRALEEANEGNIALALEFLNKEIIDNPKNGYAYLCMAVLQTDEKEYEDAMRDTNYAIKYLPKKEKKHIASAYGIRANLFAFAGDTVRALSDYETAVKLYPDNIDVLESYGQLLYELDRYDESQQIYQRLAYVNPGGILGYMGLGRNAFDCGNYDEAIKQFEAVIRQHDDYSPSFACRGECYFKQGKYLEAIDDFIKALTIDNSAKAFFYLFEFPAEQTKLVTTKLKGMAVKDPYDASWWFYIGQVYKVNKLYAEAIDAFKKANDIDAYSGFAKHLAECYYNLGDYGRALTAINEFLQEVSDDDYAQMLKGDILNHSGDVDGSIEQWTAMIDAAPDYYFPYYRRGFVKDNADRTEEALEDYDMAIMLRPDHAYSYLGRGDMLMRLGQTDKAMEAYRRVVELDTVPGDDSCAMYAFLALGEKEKAVDFMIRVIESDTAECGNYYDGACFYSRLGDLDKSLANLRLALEKGYRRFHHIRSDDDLVELRKTPEFEILMQEYETAVTQTQEIDSPESDILPVSERIEIPFTPDGGCLSVKCAINNLPLTFVFDTGASTVSMSQLEANFMLKNGYLKSDDIVGSERFMDANGNISEGTIINLREVDFGGMKLSNVRASVVRNQKAPLLLGQSVLGRLGTIEIDNPAKKIIITNNH